MGWYVKFARDGDNERMSSNGSAKAMECGSMSTALGSLGGSSGGGVGVLGGMGMGI